MSVEELKSKDAQSAEQKGQIKLDASAAETTYSNFVLVAAGPEEMVLTFGMRAADDANVKINDRVILSPKNAKRFLAALSQSMRTYEERFGVIDASFPQAKEQAGS